MSVPKATVARRAYNRALRDYERDMEIARDAAREVASVTGVSNDVRFVAWLRGVDFVIARARRMLK